MKNYANYNLWANNALINWLKNKPKEQLEKEVASSFPSIKLTLLHIWKTQEYWLSIINKTAYREMDDEEIMKIEEVFTGILAQSAELAEFVEEMSDYSMEEQILIVSQWFQSDFPAFEYLMHCFNHSTYHRGQLVTIGRHLGFTDAPMTDYNYYNVLGK
ncbi:DinB family protein [Olivibacter sp. SDN3]|nr:DinB family protein [Olivibacter sp. SDN3]